MHIVTDSDSTLFEANTFHHENVPSLRSESLQLEENEMQVREKLKKPVLHMQALGRSKLTPHSVNLALEEESQLEENAYYARESLRKPPLRTQKMHGAHVTPDSVNLATELPLHENTLLTHFGS